MKNSIIEQKDYSGWLVKYKEGIRDFSDKDGE